MNIYTVTLSTSPVKGSNTLINVFVVKPSDASTTRLVCADSIEEAISKIRKDWEIIKEEYIVLETGYELKDIQSVVLKHENIIY